MKQRFMILALLLAFASYATADEPGHHFFILAGGNNMIGRDPEASFTAATKKGLSTDRVIVYMSTHLGGEIYRWHKDWKPPEGEKAPNRIGDEYERIIKKFGHLTKGKKVASVTLVWMQGESDAREGYSKIYADSLLGVYQNLCKDLDRQDINFVIGRLNDYGVKRRPNPHWAVVRDAQVEVAKSNKRFDWVDTDDLNGKGDFSSNTEEGAAELGKLFAQKAIALIGKK